MPHYCWKTYNSTMLLDFPLDLFGNWVSSWLDMKNILSLDSAYCSGTERPVFLQLLNSDRTILPTLPASIDFVLIWATKRRVKCETLQVGRHIKLDILYDYLRGGIPIENLHLRGLMDTFSVNLIVATHCRNIISIYFCSCSVSKTFKSICEYCVFLKEIIMCECTDLRAGSLDEISCPSLETLALCACNCDDQCVLAAVSMHNNIFNLNIGGNSNLTDQVVCEVVTRLPQLRKLGLGGVDIAEGTVAKIAALEMLTAVDLCGCLLHGDEDILSLVTQCKHLEQLVVMNNELSKAAMLAIAEHCPRLKRLLIDKCNDATAEDEISLLDSCTQLESLGMYFSSSAVVAHIPASVTTLTILAMNATDEILTAVSLRCQNLSKLIIFYQAPNRLYSVDGLVAIAKGCTRLRELVLDSDAAQVSELALKLWRNTCPNLKVVNDVDNWEYEVFKPTGYHT